MFNHLFYQIYTKLLNKDFRLSSITSTECMQKGCGNTKLNWLWSFSDHNQYKLQSHILAGQYILSHQHQHSGRECSNTVEGWKLHAQNVLIPNIAHHIKRKKTYKKITICDKRRGFISNFFRLLLSQKMITCKRFSLKVRGTLDGLKWLSINLIGGVPLRELAS